MCTVLTGNSVAQTNLPTCEISNERANGQVSALNFALYFSLTYTMDKFHFRTSESSGIRNCDEGRFEFYSIPGNEIRSHCSLRYAPGDSSKEQPFFVHVKAAHTHSTLCFQP